MNRDELFLFILLWLLASLRARPALAIVSSEVLARTDTSRLFWPEVFYCLSDQSKAHALVSTCTLTTAFFLVRHLGPS